MSLDIGTLLHMETADFQKTLDQLMREKSKLEEQRTNLENELLELKKKIAHIEEIVEHLGPLAGFVWDTEREISKLGLTDAIRAVLQRSPERMSAVEVRKKLEELNYDLSGLTAPMSSVYKILGRISNQDPADYRRIEEEGRVYFQYVGIRDEDIPF